MTTYAEEEHVQEFVGNVIEDVKGWQCTPMDERQVLAKLKKAIDARLNELMVELKAGF